ncbi:MAG: hypothetical protein WAO76_00375 [Georgfuchsia sp.]
MKVKVFAAWVQTKWLKEPQLQLDSIDLATLYKDSTETIAIAAGEFDLDLDIAPLDHAEAVKSQVAALKREAGEHQAALTNIEARINELLCLEHKP